MTKTYSILVILLFSLLGVSAQTYNQMDASGNITQRNENNGNFNPHSNDTTGRNKEVPKGIHVWTVDRKFGDMKKGDILEVRVAISTVSEENAAANLAAEAGEGVTFEEFVAELGAYIEYYNEGRIKQSLGWKSPMQYRRSLGLAA